MFGEKACGENWNTHLCKIRLSMRDKTDKHECATLTSLTVTGRPLNVYCIV